MGNEYGWNIGQIADLSLTQVYHLSAAAFDRTHVDKASTAIVIRNAFHAANTQFNEWVRGLSDAHGGERPGQKVAPLVPAGEIGRDGDIG